jgi:AraC-like DNA-binding protein
MFVEAELLRSNLHPLHIDLGEVLLEDETISSQQLNSLSENLKKAGFELIDDKRSRLIEGIKTFIIEKVHYKGSSDNLKLSEQLSRHLHHDYSYLSNLFSEVEGITIEQFTINHKIEKVKELLIYDQLSLSQIALDLGYSSTAHLSNQFKRLTGLTPSSFKKMGTAGRKSLDELGSKK